MRPIDDTALEVINVSRRAFLGTVSAVGLMLAVGCSPRPATTDQPKYGADSMPHGWVDNPLVFVAIAPDGTVTIVCHRSKMVGFQWILDHLALARGPG